MDDNISGDDINDENEEEGLDALSSVYDIGRLIYNFDKIPPQLQSFIMYQLMRRSTRPALQNISSIILANSKRNFIEDLPQEIASIILQNLDGDSLAQVALVRRGWFERVNMDSRAWLIELQRRSFSNHTSSWSLSKAIARRPSLLTQYNLGGDPSVAVRNIVPVVGYCRRNSRTLFSSQQQQQSMHSQRHHSHHSRGRSQMLLSPPNPVIQTLADQEQLLQNWANGDCTRMSIYTHEAEVVTSLQFDDDKIVSASDQGVVHVFDIRTGELVKRFMCNGGVWAMQYVGSTMVTGSIDRTIRVWDMERCVCTHMFTGHGSTVRCLALLFPDEYDLEYEKCFPIIISGSRDHMIRVWKLPSPSKDPPYPPPDSKSYPPGTCGHQYEHTPPNPYLMHTLTGHTDSVRAVAGAGRIMVSGGYDHTVRIWDILKGVCLRTLEGHQQRVYTVSVERARNRCYSGSADMTAKVWNLTTGECLFSLRGHSQLVGLLETSPNLIVTGSGDASLRVWDIDDGSFIDSLQTQHIENQTLHPDEPRRQQLQQGQQQDHLAITSFQYDEIRAISGSAGTVKLWDMKTMRYIRDLAYGLTHVWQVKFDKRRVVIAAHSNTRTHIEVFDFGRPTGKAMVPL
ncbi:WD40 repeat-like protein, partial [Ramicandelaber brevisporus]